jgi:hypothetical protein
MGALGRHPNQRPRQQRITRTNPLNPPLERTKRDPEHSSPNVVSRVSPNAGTGSICRDPGRRAC